MTNREFTIDDLRLIAYRMSVCEEAARSIMEIPTARRVDLLETVCSMYGDLAQQLEALYRWSESANIELLSLNDYQLKPKAREELDRMLGIRKGGAEE